MKIKKGGKGSLTFFNRITSVFSRKKRRSIKDAPSELPVSFPPGSAGGGRLPKPGKVLAKDKLHID